MNTVTSGYSYTPRFRVQEKTLTDSSKTYDVMVRDEDGEEHVFCHARDEAFADSVLITMNNASLGL